MTVSVEGTEVHPPGLKEYLVVHGRGRLEEGGAPELLQRVARVYLAPDVRFRPMGHPSPGVKMQTEVERVDSIGPWAAH